MIPEWAQQIPIEAAAIASVAAASGAMSSARYVYFASSRKGRLSCARLLLCGCSLAVGGAVIGGGAAALFFDRTAVLSSLGKAVLLSIVCDPMNVPASLRYLQLVARALASIRIDGPPENMSGSDSTET